MHSMMETAATSEMTRLVSVAMCGVAVLLFLIIRSKLQAFVALLLVSLLIGVAAGMPLDAVLESVTNGMGDTLGAIAVLVGLGAMFGRMLEVSGGGFKVSPGRFTEPGKRSSCRTPLKARTFSNAWMSSPSIKPATCWMCRYGSRIV